MAEKPEKTWPEWTDFLGNTFRPGDYIVYAALAYGRSAQLVFAQVERINKINSKGMPILRFNPQTRVKEPSCTVTVRRLESGRYGGVWQTRQFEKRLVTIQDVRLIVKIENSYMEQFEKLEAEEVDKAMSAIVSKYREVPDADDSHAGGTDD